MKWWLRQESNQRHTELQSVALPTELQSHGGPDGNWTAISSVTGKRIKPLYHWTVVAEIGFEPMTFGLWAQRATNCSTPLYNGGQWGIRTPAGREAPGSFQDCSLQPGLGNCPWWTQQDSNLWPTGYEPVALTNWAMGPYQTLLSCTYGSTEENRTLDLPGMNRML